MRAWRGSWLLAAVLVVSGCATQKASQKTADATTGSATAAPRGLGGSGQAGTAKWVDEALGFEVTRPSDAWRLDVTSDHTEEGIATPVVMRNSETGAQVVIQVAPAVATPVQFAERLTEGMRSHPGFETSDPEPVPLSDSAVGFRFAMGEKVLGRVAVREGAQGRVLMMLATWPNGATESALAGVDQIFQSVQPVEVQ